MYICVCVRLTCHKILYGSQNKRFKKKKTDQFVHQHMYVHHR